MADEQDLASEREEIARQYAIRRAAKDIPQHTQGDCTRCGEAAWLIRKLCTPCRGEQERRR